MKGLSFHISVPQCDLLIGHCNGPRLINLRDNSENIVRRALIAQALIREEPGLHITACPTHTVLTDKGRETVCIILGNYIDRLVEANVLKDRPAFVAASYKRELVQAFL